MRVVITGGAGFIGSHVVETLIAKGNDVHVIDNLSTGNRTWIHPSAVLHECDIRDSSIKSLIQSLQPNVIVHLAAQADVKHSQEYPSYDLAVNACGTIQLLEACSSGMNTHFIFASTSAVYGNDTDRIISEQSSTEPCSCYGLSKWTAEQYIQLFMRQYHLKATILRFSNVYGPRQTPKGEGGVVALFTDRIYRNESILIHGDGEQTRDFIYVKDIASAIDSVIGHGLDGVYNLGTGQSISINELSRIYEQLSGRRIQRIWGEPRKGDIRHSCLCSDRLKADSLWKPYYSLRHGLECTWKYVNAAD